MASKSIDKTKTRRDKDWLTEYRRKLLKYLPIAFFCLAERSILHHAAQVLLHIRLASGTHRSKNIQED